MTAPPLKGRKLTCHKKRRHPDQLTARACAMASIQHNKDVSVLYVYRCPECRGWHLTRSHNKGFKVTADDPVQIR